MSLIRTKTDKIVCLVIVHFISSKNDFLPYQQSLYHLDALKRLTRLREAFVSQRSLILVKMTNVLDAVSPEFKYFFSNKPKFSTTLFILKKFKFPRRIARWSDSDLVIIHNISWNVSINKHNLSCDLFYYR